ncbi:NETI motif-containing protein [Bacillus solimangrovi]|uniref:NETI motif-containing protein n=1 Tax=Bacillus solimangrovi TaxID=1305675 RepID=A0A1E5LH53_9BACI|nr:NETI motif-containing protein [Bacillus solimangrovi]OEH93408.1 hypothetical protein BFG57_12210 [Bacillus solimangrovi]
MSKKKKRFEVAENETISNCLDRMKKAGYAPIRRMEEPIFEEVNENGKLTRKPLRQKILFDGIIIDADD